MAAQKGTSYSLCCVHFLSREQTSPLIRGLVTATKIKLVWLFVLWEAGSWVEFTE